MPQAAPEPPAPDPAEGGSAVPEEAHARGTEEFSRVIAFSDGIFAIAMTLLVVEVAVPALSDAESVRELADKLNEMSEQIVSFFISFAVIGRYWLAHHSFIGELARMDTGLIFRNLVYLAFIAFVPFPTALLGDYFYNPLAVSIYAVVIAVVSGLEVWMFRHAYRNNLLRTPPTAESYRWDMLQSLAPVAFFLVSVPLAFWSSVAAVVAWWLVGPFEAIVSRRRRALGQ
ncbi:MAG TPA: TMEM175 family protein [Solirubrobacterales bacterium]|jgi:uncharacterized membrane protein